MRRVLATAFWFFLAISPNQLLAAGQLAIQVGFPPGALHDTAARLVANHIGRFLGDSPSVIVQNVPGAGGLKLMRLFADTEPGDGSVIAILNLSQIVSTILFPEQTGIAPNEYKWIGALTDEPGVCFVNSATDIRTIEDFRTKGFKLGATSKTATAYIEAEMLKNLLGAKYQIVTGFTGGPEANLAIARGELDGGCGISLYSFLRSDLSRDKRIIGYFGPAPREGSAYQAIPSFADMFDDELDLRAVKLLTTAKFAVDSFALPPSAPDEVVEAYRTAFDKMVADPGFLRDAEKVIPMITPHSGQEVEALVEAAINSDADVVARARELVQ